MSAQPAPARSDERVVLTSSASAVPKDFADRISYLTGKYPPKPGGEKIDVKTKDGIVITSLEPSAESHYWLSRSGELKDDAECMFYVIHSHFLISGKQPDVETINRMSLDAVGVLFDMYVKRTQASRIMADFDANSRVPRVLH